MSTNATTNYSRHTEINKKNNNSPVNEKKLAISRFPATTEYDRFKLVNQNRPVKRAHVEFLKKSIEQLNLLHIRPIQVDEDFNVYDGQHRLIAAQELNIPIYYEVSKDLNDESMIILNNGQKIWGFDDYLNFYVQKNYPDYKIVKELIEKYKLFITTILSSFSAGGNTDTLTSLYKEGKLKLKNKEIIEKILDKYNIIIEIIKSKVSCNDRRYITTRNFQVALLRFLQEEEISFDIFTKKINQRITFLHSCPTKGHYYKMFEDIYNYRNSTPINIYS